MSKLLVVQQNDDNDSQYCSPVNTDLRRILDRRLTSQCFVFDMFARKCTVRASVPIAMSGHPGGYCRKQPP